jgi:hypothetical protein
MFYCETCDFTCIKKATYDKHLQTTKHLENVNLNEDINSDSTNIIVFRCDKCNKNYKYKTSFINHTKKCGGNETGLVEITDIQVPSSQSTSKIMNEVEDIQHNNNKDKDKDKDKDNTTLILVNEIGTMMKTMSQIVTTLDLTIVTLNKMYNADSKCQTKSQSQ